MDRFFYNEGGATAPPAALAIAAVTFLQRKKVCAESAPRQFYLPRNAQNLLLSFL